MARTDNAAAIRAWQRSHPAEMKAIRAKYESSHQAQRRAAKRAWARAHRAQLDAYHAKWRHSGGRTYTSGKYVGDKWVTN